MTDDAPGLDAWKQHTSAFDRVRSVAGSVSKPRPVSYIAAEAHVAENTARDHLDRLAEMNVVRAHDHEGTACYAPDPLHTRMQTLRDLLDAHDHDGLLDLKAYLQDRIEAWQDSHDATGPDDLRAAAAAAETAAETRELKRTVQDWELAAYRLDIVEDAIEHYGTYTRTDQATA